MYPLQSERSEQQQAAPRRKWRRRILQQSWHIIQVGYLKLLDGVDFILFFLQ